MLRKTLRRERVPAAAAAALLVESILGDVVPERGASPQLQMAGTSRIVLMGSGLLGVALMIELGSIDLGNLVMDLKVRDGYAFTVRHSTPDR